MAGKKNTTKLKTAAKKAILNYIKTHTEEEASRKKLIDHLTTVPEIQELKAARRSKKIPEEDLDITPKSYEHTVDTALRELLEENQIMKKGRGKSTRYKLIDEKPVLLNLYNEEIAIFQLKSGDINLAKEMIDANKDDENLVVIPVGDFLLCTMKNKRDEEIEYSQLPHIRSCTRKALKAAEGKVKKS